MKTWSVHDAQGFFTGRVVTASDLVADAVLKDNLRPGLKAIAGRYDRICQRVDLATGTVVDHQPPQPSDDHEWIAENPDVSSRAGQRWRWQKRADITQWEDNRVRAQARLYEIDARRSRALSDQIIDPSARAADGKTARERLIELEAEAESCRAVLRMPKPSPPAAPSPPPESS